MHTVSERQSNFSDVMKHRFPNSQSTKKSAARHDETYVTKRNDAPSETVAQRRERQDVEARAGWDAYVEQNRSVDENMMRLRKLRLEREAASQQRQESTDAGNNVLRDPLSPPGRRLDRHGADRG
jgi:hypothetical protein